MGGSFKNLDPLAWGIGDSVGGGTRGDPLLPLQGGPIPGNAPPGPPPPGAGRMPMINPNMGMPPGAGRMPGAPMTPPNMTFGQGVQYAPQGIAPITEQYPVGAQQLAAALGGSRGILK